MGRIVDQRHLMPRANNPPSGLFPVRPETAINKVVVHHSATTSGSALAYANWHIDNNGWETIAYHYVIDKNGTINWTLPWHKKGWHGNSANYSSLGICLTGHFDLETPTTAQLESLIWLILHLEQSFGKRLAIDPHNKYNGSKSCPGNNFDLEYIRSRVRNFTMPPSNQQPMNQVMMAAGALLLLMSWRK